ncbi:HAD family hydrolase [Candidatus Magnetominusculus dajiuhuensis]|uniref:HAD family hydrolase n=1 Tax=Candidatus Magnetominusculus dajiuhuensis TaxID=3137712 RepID=UPI003B429563
MVSGKLILFDIDGTLMDAGGAGGKSLSDAFYELFSIKDAFRNIRFDGKTDLRIFKEGLKYHKLTDGNGVIASIREQYLSRLRLEICTDKKHIKPGITALIEGLRGKNRIGLLTGNLRAGAEIKLSSVGLWQHFGGGAFGDAHEDRNRLLPIAVEDFYKNTGVRFSFSQCVIIGDTPKDVDVGKTHGAFTIAVATGPYTVGELAEAGADAVFNDLSDTNAVLALIDGGAIAGN